MWLAGCVGVLGRRLRSTCKCGSVFQSNRNTRSPSPLQSVSHSLQHCSWRGFNSGFSFPQQAPSLLCRHELECFLQREKCFNVFSCDPVSTLFFLLWKAKASYVIAGSHRLQPEGPAALRGGMAQCDWSQPSHIAGQNWAPFEGLPVEAGS